MNFKFITAIHNLSLPSKDISVTLESGEISNKIDRLDEIFDNKLTLSTIGLHSSDEIREAPSYYVVDGDFGKDLSLEDVNSIGASFCFALLRQIQLYVSKIWMLCDNSIYVRDGFLYVYDDKIADGFTFKASVSAINTFSRGEIKNITLTENVLLTLSKNMDIIHLNDVLSKTQDFKQATQFQHYKKSRLTRKEFAEMYVNLARKEGLVPVKVLMYCSALEALVANSTSELSHRVAERVAILLGQSREDRCEIYKDIKNGYDTRSKVAHGDFIKKEESIILDLSFKLDNYLRRLFQLNEPFSTEGSDLDQYFLNKLMD